MLKIENTIELETNDKNSENDLDDSLESSLNLIPLDEQQENIAREIIKADTQQELQDQFNLFNITQTKKNALRIIKLNSLLDKVENQAIQRFEKRPDQISNKEILEYMQVVSTQIDRSQQMIDSLKDKQMIKVNNQKNEVNINIGTDLDRDSKERVIDAIQCLLKEIKNQTEEGNIITQDIVSSDDSKDICSETENIISVEENNFNE